MLACLTDNLSASSQVQSKKDFKGPLFVPDALNHWRSNLKQTRSDLCKCQKNRNKLELGYLKLKTQENLDQLCAIQDASLTRGWQQERLAAIASFEVLNTRLLELYVQMPALRQSRFFV